jgi:predicted RNA binding protein YcfA (HicA-like mRNA interferase family)
MLKPLKPKDIIKILLANWFIKKRQTWSHIVFRKEDKIAIVPFHGSKDIPVPVIKSIIKQSWLEEYLFN